MNNEDSKTSKSNKLIHQFHDKLNLKTPNNKTIGLDQNNRPLEIEDSRNITLIIG